jgi:hypothetical protein
MTGGSLTVSYHKESTIGLAPQERRELDALLRPLRVDVEFDAFEDRHTLSRRLSLVGDAAALMIVVGGTLASKTMLQELAKDLYKFAKERVSREKKRAGYLAVILDIECEGERYHVGVDFADEMTVKIGFFRLHAWLADPPAAERSGSEPHRIKYPTSRGGAQALVAGLAGLAAAAAVGAALWPRQPAAPRTGPWPWPPSPRDVALIAAFGAFLGTYLVLVILLFLVSDRVIAWRYRRRYGRDAERWVLDVEPLPGLPPGTKLQVHTERRSST